MTSGADVEEEERSWRTLALCSTSSSLSLPSFLRGLCLKPVSSSSALGCYPGWVCWARVARYKLHSLVYGRGEMKMVRRGRREKGGRDATPRNEGERTLNRPFCIRSGRPRSEGGVCKRARENLGRTCRTENGEDRRVNEEYEKDGKRAFIDPPDCARLLYPSFYAVTFHRCIEFKGIEAMWYRNSNSEIASDWLGWIQRTVLNASTEQYHIGLTSHKMACTTDSCWP